MQKALEALLANRGAEQLKIQARLTVEDGGGFSKQSKLDGDRFAVMFDYTLEVRKYFVRKPVGLSQEHEHNSRESSWDWMKSRSLEALSVGSREGLASRALASMSSTGMCMLGVILKTKCSCAHYAVLSVAEAQEVGAWPVLAGLASLPKRGSNSGCLA